MAEQHQWIFGYGSLIWRPCFMFEHQRVGYIEGFSRRFWQASADHRGTPAFPGRVVTLVPQPGVACWGMGYRIHPEHVDEILTQLDVREQGGYERTTATLHWSSTESVADAVVYVGNPQNPYYAGPATVRAIADIVGIAHGPSGSNREYVLRLAEALVALQIEDDHVSDLARLLHDCV